MTRSQCLPGGEHYHRPCPYATCRHHALVDVDSVGRLRLPHGTDDPLALAVSCTLDVADEGEAEPAVAAAAIGIDARHAGEVVASGMRAFRRGLVRDVGGDER